MRKEDKIIAEAKQAYQAGNQSNSDNKMLMSWHSGFYPVESSVGEKTLPYGYAGKQKSLKFIML